jgi:hypothetical protein
VHLCRRIFKRLQDRLDTVFGPLGVDELQFHRNGRSGSAGKKLAADSGSGSPATAHDSPARARRCVRRRWWCPAARRRRSRPNTPTCATPPDEPRADRRSAGSLRREDCHSAPFQSHVSLVTHPVFHD